MRERKGRKGMEVRGRRMVNGGWVKVGGEGGWGTEGGGSRVGRGGWRKEHGE